MIDQHFVFLGAVIGLAGSAGYAVATVRGTVRPNRVTWFFWAAAPLIGFFAQLDDGVGLPAVMTLTVGLGPAAIFLASLANRGSYWRLSPFDFVCGAASAVALVVWLLLDDAALAVVLAVVVDAAAGLPTVVKAYRFPETEHPAVYRNAGINAAIALLTIDDWTLAAWCFPAYVAVIGFGTFAIVTIRGRRATGR